MQRSAVRCKPIAALPALCLTALSLLATSRSRNDHAAPMRRVGALSWAQLSKSCAEGRWRDGKSRTGPYHAPGTSLVWISLPPPAKRHLELAGMGGPAQQLETIGGQGIMINYRKTRGVIGVLGLMAAGWAAGAMIRRRTRRIDLKHKVVVITGGGRGLGLAIAREFAAHGCRLAICGRDGTTIANAVSALRSQGATVIGASCDASDPQAVQKFMQHVMDYYGTIDVLVNNAGQCFVGPAAQQRPQDIHAALLNIFWVQFHPTMAVLPHMRARQFGRIVNVTSIGGKLPVPHQSAYCVGKYAATGWSETLTTELANEGIRVSTITPPPIRNGAALHVHFSGQTEEEFEWFTRTLTSPLTTVEPAKTARVVVDAARYGDAQRAVSVLSWLSIRAHGVAPNLTLPLLAVGERALPRVGSTSEPTTSRLGKQVAEQTTAPRLQQLAARAWSDAARYEPKSAVVK